MLESNARGLRLRHTAFAAALVIVLAGCGGGGGGDYGGGSTTPAASTTPMTGTLSAPGGALAFNAPTGPLRFFAEFFGRNAVAALPGTSAIPGTTVKLIQINGSGNQVGADIATAVTAADGSFTLDVPTPFTPGPSFVIRATGAGTLERMVSDVTSQDVDPATTVTKSIVITQLAGGSLAGLRPTQVEQIGNRVANAVNNLVTADLANTTALVPALKTEAQKDEEIKNSLGNLTAIYGIAGTVTDAGGAPLANIKIVARDFSQWFTRAEVRTDAAGQYSMNLNAGDYIVGAMNFTAASTAASEWWTCNDAPSGPTCGSANEFSAAKVTIGASTVPVNFKLEPGARITGSIKTNNGLPLPGVQIGVRDFDSSQPIAFQDAKVDGTYLVNVRPGVYTLSARNQTAQFFATATYNGPVTAGGGVTTPGGGANNAQATRVSVAAGDVFAADFKLGVGGLVQGVVTDGTNPVSGQNVRFFQTQTPPTDLNGIFVEAVRTNLSGEYRMWVRPGTYNVRSRGQTFSPSPGTTVVAFNPAGSTPPVAVDFSQAIVASFNAVVGRARAVVRGPDNAPLAQVKVFVFDGTAATAFQAQENTNSDGSVEIYATVGNHQVQYAVDNGSTTVGSIHDDGNPSPVQLLQQTAPVVNFTLASATTPIQLGGGTITLPAGGELKGIVTINGVPTGNLLVQLRSGAGPAGFTGANRTVNTRTSADGSYSISVPGGTYTRVCASQPGINGCPNQASASSAGQYGSADGVTVVNGQSNTANIAIP